MRIIRVLGAELTDEETDLVRAGSEEADAETLRRYRASLPEKKARREGEALLSWAYGEAELRGVGPWWEDEGDGSVLSGAAEALEARGKDASSVRFFME